MRFSRRGILITLLCSTLLGTLGLGTLDPARDSARQHGDATVVDEARELDAVMPYVKPLEMIERSDLIVRGTVGSTTSGTWNQLGTLIYTDHVVAVTKVLKGNATVSSVTVRLPGGRDNSTGDQFKGLTLPQGKELLLLLTTEDLPYLDLTSTQQYYPTMWSSGIYEIVDGLASHFVRKAWDEPLAHLEARVAAVVSGAPDPYPLPGLPIVDNRL